MGPFFRYLSLCAEFALFTEWVGGESGQILRVMPLPPQGVARLSAAWTCRLGFPEGTASRQLPGEAGVKSPHNLGFSGRRYTIVATNP